MTNPQKRACRIKQSKKKYSIDHAQDGCKQNERAMAHSADVRQHGESRPKQTDKQKNKASKAKQSKEEEKVQLERGEKRKKGLD